MICISCKPHTFLYFMPEIYIKKAGYGMFTTEWFPCRIFHFIMCQMFSIVESFAPGLF